MSRESRETTAPLDTAEATETAETKDRKNPSLPVRLPPAGRADDDGEHRGIEVRIEVRIEDDILVTADGHENLSAGLPRTSDEVEAWMRGLTGG